MIISYIWKKMFQTTKQFSSVNYTSMNYSISVIEILLSWPPKGPKEADQTKEATDRGKNPRLTGFHVAEWMNGLGICLEYAGNLKEMEHL